MTTQPDDIRHTMPHVYSLLTQLSGLTRHEQETLLEHLAAKLDFTLISHAKFPDVHTEKTPEGDERAEPGVWTLSSDGRWLGETAAELTPRSIPRLKEDLYAAVARYEYIKSHPPVEHPLPVGYHFLLPRDPSEPYLCQCRVDCGSVAGFYSHLRQVSGTQVRSLIVLSPSAAKRAVPVFPPATTA